MKYFLILVLFLIGCKTPETVTPPRTEPPPLVTPLPEQEGVANTIVPLSWELPTNDGQVNQGAKPGRRIWTLLLPDFSVSFLITCCAPFANTLYAPVPLSINPDICCSPP